ncbi:MAG: RIP metalloprotease RseP [Lachnospiraceae bacterium]|nr:RIP metalloprotease RseP [Lachnospiraceae bacterium]
MNIIIALLVFTVIIVLHELGHFLLAKKNGVGVTEFSIGMGQRIITVVKTEKGFTCKFFPTMKYCDSREDWSGKTKYSWKLFPIGGSCMMVGEDEVNDAPDSFQKKGVWARISIIAAGPIFNFISAFIFAIILVANTGYNTNEVTYVKPGTPAAEAGIKEGDKIKEINGKNIVIGADYNIYFALNEVGDEPLTVKYTTSEGEEKKASISPNYNYYRLGYSYSAKTNEEPMEITSIEEGSPMEEAGFKVGDVILAMNGVSLKNTSDMENYLLENPLTENPVSITYERDGVEETTEVTPYYATIKSLQISMGKWEKGNVFQTVRYSASEIRYYIEATVKSLGMLIKGNVKKDDISGAVGIVDMIGDTVDASPSMSAVLLNLLSIAILLSANLGVMNLLPFPALDGGRLVFLFIEVVRGKPIDQEKEGIVHLIGIVLLMLLMVFVTYNDIARIIGG